MDILRIFEFFGESCYMLIVLESVNPSYPNKFNAGMDNLFSNFLGSHCVLGYRLV